MRRKLLTWLVALLIALASWLPSSHGQQPAPAGGTITQTAGPTSSQSEAPPAPLTFAAAALFTIGILVVVCMPTRKA